MSNRRIFVIGGDHNFFDAIDHLKRFLRRMGHTVIDVARSDHWRRVDYNEQAHLVGSIVRDDPSILGILGCGTGQGCAMAANKVDRIRAALCYDVDFAKKSREHNDSNVLVLGAWRNSPQEMEDILLAWLDEPWAAGRHVVRVKQMSDWSYMHEIVVAPGVFDVLLPGHVELLRYAKKAGYVVVALNSDESVERIRGQKPQQPAEWRKRVLESLAGVDEVVITDADDVGDLVSQLKAKYVVKGSNYTEEEVRKNDRLPADVKVILFPIVEEYRRD